MKPVVLGLKRGAVALAPHDAAWAESAHAVIDALRRILGGDALDIQHVGSTAVRGIAAKPIVDIAVRVAEIADMRRHDAALAASGIMYCKEEHGGQALYCMGSDEMRTHYIHVVRRDDPAWRNYLLFRDYLNAHEAAARRYSDLKRELMAQFPLDREAYTQGKQPLIQEILTEARAWERAGRR